MQHTDELLFRGDSAIVADYRLLATANGVVPLQAVEMLLWGRGGGYGTSDTYTYDSNTTVITEQIQAFK